jgi:hypothetical protein
MSCCMLYVTENKNVSDVYDMKGFKLDLLYFMLQKQYTCQNHAPFQDVVPYTSIFSITLASYWYQKHKGFNLTA